MRQIILSALLCLSISSFSQSDFLPDDSASWTGNYVTWCGVGCAWGSWMQVYHDTTSADSLVGTYSYTKLSSRVDTTITSHYALYRIDTAESQIWWIPKDSTQEVMFFDFDENYTLGDTVEIACYAYLYGGFGKNNFKLNMIDSLLIDGTYHLQYSFEKLWMPPIQGEIPDEIIVSERLICSEFPFLGKWTFETGYELMCYQESGIGLHGICPWNEYSFGGIEDVVNESFLLYPNPSKGIVTFKSKQISLADLSISDLSGKILFSDKITTNSNFNLELEPGVYIYKIKTNAGGSSGKLIIE